MGNTFENSDSVDDDLAEDISHSPVLLDLPVIEVVGSLSTQLAFMSDFE